MIGQLPESLTVNGKDYPIRSDYRDVLAVIEAQADDELTDMEKMVVTIYMLYADFGCASDVLESDIDMEELHQMIKMQQQMIYNLQFELAKLQA